MRISDWSSDVCSSDLPTRDDAYALRAAARRHLKDNAGAMEDVETALAIDARSPEALLERGILRFEKGDLAGAHKDFIQVRLLAPDTAAAVSAGQYIEQMDVKNGRASGREKCVSTCRSRGATYT